MLDLTQPRRLPPAAEAVIIGGGITGASLLHWLRLRDVNAILLERDSLAAGATGRNAGFLLQGVAANYALAVQRYGRETARAVWEFTAENHSLLRDVLPLDRVRYFNRGSWTLASGPDEASLLQESASLLAQDGFAGEWMAPLPASLGRFEGGLLNPVDGEADSAMCVRAIADAAGMDAVFERVDVEGIDFGSRTTSVHTTRGVLEAQSVFVAANAWVPNLLPAIDITPQRGQMLATEPVSDVVVERPVYSHFGYRYWRQLADGRVVVGGYRDESLEEEQTYEVATTETIQRLLEQHLREVIGVDAPVSHRWAGTMGFTRDELPLVGRVPSHQNAYLAAGYSGHGMGFAFHCAKRLVELALDSREPPAWLDPQRDFVTATDPARGSTMG